MSNFRQSTDDKSIILEVSGDAAGERVDLLLSRREDAPSRSQIKSLIEAGALSRLGPAKPKRITDPSYRAKAGETLELALPEPRDAKPAGEPIHLVVVFEDDQLIVVDKPAGMVVHPGPGHSTGTLVNALIHHCGDSLSGIGGERRPGIVHRLDKDTTGLIVAAKTDLSHQSLAQQFSRRTVERAYCAFVRGCPIPTTGVIEAPIGRDPQNRLKMAVEGSGSRPAITHYQVKTPFRHQGVAFAAEVKCRLKTGRTHQVRVHMAYIRHPLIGDALYGRKWNPPHSLGADARRAIQGFDRQALHAYELGFVHPVSGENLKFTSRLPDDMTYLRQILASACGE